MSAVVSNYKNNFLAKNFTLNYVESKNFKRSKIMFKFMFDNTSKCHNSIAMPFSRPVVAGIFRPKR